MACAVVSTYWLPHIRRVLDEGGKGGRACLVSARVQTESHVSKQTLEPAAHDVPIQRHDEVVEHAQADHSFHDFLIRDV